MRRRRRRRRVGRDHAEKGRKRKIRGHSGRAKLSETTNARFLSLFPFSLLLIFPKERGAPVYVLIIGVMLRSTV